MPDAMLPPDGPSPPDLAAMRAEFDSLDDALHDLLMRRSALSAALAAGRAKAGPPFRPGREAMILRRLLARHAGPMAPALVVRVWREVIAASLRQQSPMPVAALAGTEPLARGHFGLDAPLRVHATPARVLAALSGGEATVAILPAPADGEAADAAWWVSLDAPRLGVVAALPMLLPPGGVPTAMMLAAFAPDATPGGATPGNKAPGTTAPGTTTPGDAGLIRLERAPGTSRDAAAAALSAAGFAPSRLVVAANGARVLAEVAGLVGPDDPRLAALAAHRPVPLGGYALPIVLPGAAA